MILKTCVLLVLSVTCDVWSASFSNVYLQTGPEAAPTYLQYGVPSYAYEYVNSQIAQLNSAPVPSYGYRTPCTTSACFYTEQTIAPVAPVAPSANVVAYNAPVSNLPVVYAPSQNEPTGYSYVIVDQNTRDYKIHSKLSDGGVGRGEYLFRQPEGLIHEVQYVADNTKGFNAIVKNLVTVEEVNHTGTVYNAPPCPEVKSEAITAHERREPLQDQEAHSEDLEARQSSGKQLKANEKPEAQKVFTEEIHEPFVILVEQLEESQSSHEKPDEGSTEKVEEQTHENLEVLEGQRPHEKIVEESQTDNVPQADIHEQDLVESNVYVSYNDIIKCIEAAMTKVNTHSSVARPTSPLTYLVFNKLC